MILIKQILLAFVGLAGGASVAAGVFAFITMIGIVPRLASRTNTAKYILLYEDMVILGGMAGNLISVYEIKIPVRFIGLAIFGIFSGIFVGCLAMALAEILNVIPVFVRRSGLKQGIPIITLAIAFGKALGAFYQLFLGKG